MRVHAASPHAVASAKAGRQAIFPLGTFLLAIFLLGATLLAGSLLSAGSVHAQSQGAPPHPPGTICFTPRFWCWANPPGPPGSPCSCPSPTGAVAGLRG